MDFHGMKRKRLQALCKKHDIPANLKNSEMADRLSLLFKEKEMEDPVGSGNARMKKDAILHCVGGKNVEMIDLVTPSSGSKERSVFYAKHLKGSEIERLEFETNFSPEIIREEFGICGVGEDMKSRLKKEHVNSQGGLHLAPVAVALEEFNNHLREEEAEKLSDKNNLIGDICENGRERTEAAEQDEHNSLQGSSMKDVKILHVSQEESGYPVEEKDEVVEQGDHNSPPGSNMKDVIAFHDSREEYVYPVVEEDEAIDQGDCISSQVSSMKDVKIFHISQEEYGYPVAENDEVVEQGDHNSPRGPNTKDVNILHVSEEEYGFPMVDEANALKQGDRNSSQGPSTKDVTALHVSRKETDCPIVEDVAVEQGDNNSPKGPIMKDVNILYVSQKESDYPIVKEDVAVEQGDQNSPQGPNMKEVNALHVFLEESGYPMVEEEGVVEQGDHNNPQSNLKDVDVMHVSQEEFDYPTVEEVQKSDGNICNGSVYDLTDTGSEVDAKNTDGKTNLTAEHSADYVPSSLNKSSVGTQDQFHRSYPENEVKSSGLNIHQVTSEEELKSPQNTGSVANPGEFSGFSPNILEASVVERFQSETYFDPSTIGDVGTCNTKESMQSYKMEKVEYSQEALHTTANVNLLHRSMEEGNMHIEQGEVIGLFDNSDVHDDTGVNGRSEVDTRCLDISIRTINNDDGKTNVTIEQFTNELQSSTFEDSDGTPVQFLSNDALSEVKTDFNSHEIVVSGIVTKNVMSEAKFVSSRKISLNQASDRMIGFSPEQLNNSESKVLQSETKLFPETARIDVGIGEVVESMQMDVNKELVDDSQQGIHAASCVMDLNNEDFMQVAFDEDGHCVLEGEIDKSCLIADSEEVDIEICDVEENMQIIVNEKQVDESQQRATPSVMVSNNVDLVQVALVEVEDHLLEGEVEKSGLNADSEECIGFLPNNLLPSATKGLEEETYFDGSTLGDVEAFKMEENMPSDKMEKEYSLEVLDMANELVLLPRSTEESDSVQEEVTRLINSCDDHEYVGLTGQEDGKNQHNMKRDMDSIEKYLLNDFHSFEDASGQSSDENAPTMPQHGETKLCTFNHQQMFASGAFSGDKLETSPKCTPIPKLRESYIKKESKIVSSLPVKRARDILEASDMKENIKISKKEQVGTIISRSAFPKRKPLQDLQQN
ncbi:hypothetical protein PHAVU_004G092800 [Phaseolus vulgaris]|uniref:Uncharacterized protein n=1 Tax=Phaseolus vulgaris TaxID=3885 RepID=V7C1D1_PHAVU|nr:hypothetical protein PHAVU_004G092800g [Phaseolus vulgaris]ESW23987.1 hypothetical protein PHAVU_004G092800g [Phaseolus vulgaris]